MDQYQGALQMKPSYAKAQSPCVTRSGASMGKEDAVPSQGANKWNSPDP